MPKQYICKECSTEVKVSYYISKTHSRICPSCKDAAREAKRLLDEEQKNFKTCVRCEEVFDKRNAENPKKMTCPTCLEKEAAENQKKKEDYEFFNNKRRNLWARTLMMRVKETASDYESCVISQERWSRDEFIGLMVKESHSDTRRYDSRLALGFISMEALAVSSSERTDDHINGMVPTIKAIATAIDKGELKTPDEVIAFLDNYSCTIKVSKKLNSNGLKVAQNEGHITPQKYFELSEGMWSKKLNREVSLDEFIEMTSSHFLSMR
jgi:hypothetical protein